VIVSGNTLLQANALRIPLADESVHMVCTSPPYWGLRDYGTARWEGGEAECDHNPQRPDGGERADRTLPLGRGGLYHTTCGKCGAVRIDAQLGLEATIDEYVASMVAVFREVKRVLRDDGVVFLNLGDSYAGGSRDPNPNGKQGTNRGTVEFDPGHFKGFVPNGLKPKDLCGVPWRVALGAVAIAGMIFILTAGFGLLSEEAYPAVVEQLFADEGYPEVRAINAGMTGDTTAGGLRTGGDLAEDRVAILAARVLVGQDDETAPLAGHATHERTLRRVPFPSRAEDGDDRAATRRRLRHDLVENGRQ